MEPKSESITLYYREGTSDKVYQASIDPAEGSPGNFLVNFAYGRRGATLNTGCKTAKPVAMAEAKKIYDKIVNEKKAKGYSPGEEGTPYQQTDKSQRATGIFPQLLNAIDESQVELLIADDKWWMQEKLDGRRILIRRDESGISAINRLGLTVGISQAVGDALLSIKSPTFLIDGESIGDRYHIFDLLEHSGDDLRKSPYSLRYEQLQALLKPVKAQSLQMVIAATEPKKKRAMFDKMKAENREGVVFKDHQAHYVAGRPASGGSQRKFKFTATASCIVQAINNGKRSVAMSLFDGKSKVNVGNVTISANQSIPAEGSIIEVRYLYAYPGGSLFQPVFIGVRDDIAEKACKIDQLKLKAEGSSDNDEEG